MKAASTPSPPVRGREAAVIGVTRGAIRKLSRDELQGVIAHEFSHILNGDMRLNLRLIGLNFGIMAIGYIGLQTMRSRAARRATGRQCRRRARDPRSSRSR